MPYVKHILVFICSLAQTFIEFYAVVNCNFLVPYNVTPGLLKLCRGLALVENCCWALRFYGIEAFIRFILNILGMLICTLTSFCSLPTSNDAIVLIFVQIKPRRAEREKVSTLF